MGDDPSLPILVTPRPGIMLVRPSLRERSDENAAVFRRWTAMHFRDLLNCHPPMPGHKGIVRALRYTNAGGDLFYTIHTDDIAVFKTQPYYEISRRLDLENTRALRRDEVSVLREGQSFGPEPMIWDITNAEFGIFEEHKGATKDQLNGETYHDVSAKVLSNAESEIDAPDCVLLTLTCIHPHGIEEQALLQQVELLREGMLESLHELYGTAGRVVSSLYRHVLDAQPDMHPTIRKGEDGDGAWVACFLIEGEDYEEAQKQLQPHVEGLVQERKETECEVGWDVKVGLWSGDSFLVR